eukprot:scaffold64227_cov26-Tisochrysis_lutea.AAC.2
MVGEAGSSAVPPPISSSTMHGGIAPEPAGARSASEASSTKPAQPRPSVGLSTTRAEYCVRSSWNAAHERLGERSRARLAGLDVAVPPPIGCVGEARVEPAFGLVERAKCRVHVEVADTTKAQGCDSRAPFGGEALRVHNVLLTELGEREAVVERGDEAFKVLLGSSGFRALGRLLDCSRRVLHLVLKVVPYGLPQLQAEVDAPDREDLAHNWQARQQDGVYSGTQRRQRACGIPDDGLNAPALGARPPREDDCSIRVAGAEQLGVHRRLGILEIGRRLR